MPEAISSASLAVCSEVSWTDDQFADASAINLAASSILFTSLATVVSWAISTALASARYSK